MPSKFPASRNILVPNATSASQILTANGILRLYGGTFVPEMCPIPNSVGQCHALAGVIPLASDKPVYFLADGGGLIVHRVSLKMFAAPRMPTPLHFLGGAGGGATSVGLPLAWFLSSSIKYLKKLLACSYPCLGSAEASPWRSGSCGLRPYRKSSTLRWMRRTPWWKPGLWRIFVGYSLV